MKILFLYSELAGYTLTCLKQFKEEFPESSLFVVRWPVNKEAPFNFDFEGITVLEKSDYPGDQLSKKVAQINPDGLVVSGWMDKDYTAIAKLYKKKIPVVLTIDNHWRGDLKQIVASKLSRFLIRNKFNRVWVPGEVQAKFARKLGFKENHIFKGFYSADVELFEGYGIRCKEEKRAAYPKRLLYVGRYVEHKGIFDIWNAFIELQDEETSEWELWSVGTGDQWENRLEHDKIKHLGFVQPNEFADIINKTSVYLLPSHYEPWGVSLHEFAAAGYPVLVSDKVGSSEAFCTDAKNGYVFESGNLVDLKNKLKILMNMNQKTYNEMSEESIRLSESITPTTWAITLNEIITNG